MSSLLSARQLNEQTKHMEYEAFLRAKSQLDKGDGFKAQAD